MIDSHNVHGLTADSNPLAKVAELRSGMVVEGTYAYLMQETWLFGDNTYDCGDGFVLVTSGKKKTGAEQRGSGGTGILLSPAAVRDWNRGGSWVKRYTHGLLAIRLSARKRRGDDSRSHDLFLISSYSPDASKKAEERRKHLDLLDQCINLSKQHETLVVGTDANVRLGIRTKMTPRRTLGPFGIPAKNPIKNHGPGIETRTLRLLESHRLCAATTYFRSSRVGGHTTFTHRTKKAVTQVQIDYIYIRQRDLKKCKKAWCSGKELIESDHSRLRIILTDTPFRMQAKPPTRPRPDCSLLLDSKNPDTVVFRRTISQSVAELGDYKLSEFYAAIRSAVSKLPPKREFNRKEWFVQSKGLLLPLLNTRYKTRELKRKLEKSGGRRYRTASSKHRDVNRAYTAAKRVAIRLWMREQAEKVNPSGEFDIGKRSSKEAFAILNNVAGGHSKVSVRKEMVLRDPVTNEPCSTTERTAQVYEAHLRKAHATPTPYDADLIDTLRQREVKKYLSNVPTQDEICRAVKRQRNGKATGVAQVPVEAYKAMVSSAALREVLCKLVSKMWKTGSYSGEHPLPPELAKEQSASSERSCECCAGSESCTAEGEDTEGMIYDEWLVAQHIHVPKKGALDLPKNWRSICVLDILSTIVTAVMAERIQNWSKDRLPETQNGFRRQRGTRDSIWTVTQALKQRRKAGLTTWAAAVDLRTAFDSLSREAMFHILERYGFPKHFVNVLKRFHDGSRLHAKVGKTQFEVPNKAGPRCGDSAAPDLFNICMMAIFELIKWPPGTAPVFVTSKYMNGVKKHFELPNNEFADDVWLMAIVRAAIELFLAEFQRVVKAASGMTVHAAQEPDPEPEDKSKSVAMLFPPPNTRYEDFDTSVLSLKTGIPGRCTYVHFVKQTVYLGVVIHFDLGAGEAIQARVTQATAMFAKYANVFTSADFVPKVKGSLMAAVVLPSLLYGSEVWTATVAQKRALTTFWMGCCRSALGITQRSTALNRIHSETVRERLGVKAIEVYMRQRRLSWYGTLARMGPNRYPRYLLTSSVCVGENDEQPRPRAAPIVPAPPPRPPPPPVPGIRAQAQRMMLPSPLVAHGWRSPPRFRGRGGTFSVAVSRNVSKCKQTGTTIQVGEIRFKYLVVKRNGDKIGHWQRYYSVAGMMVLLASDERLHEVVNEEIPGLDALSPEEQGIVRQAISEEVANETRRLRRQEPTIEPVVRMPWTCSRCKKVFKKRKGSAERHVQKEDCRVPRRRAPHAEQPVDNAPVYGKPRRLTWVSGMRKDLKGQVSITAQTRGCVTCARVRVVAGRPAAACDRCFFLNWMGAAQDNSRWDSIVYGDQESESHVTRRRKNKWKQPSDEWVDPRPAELRRPQARNVEEQ